MISNTPHRLFLVVLFLVVAATSALAQDRRERRQATIVLEPSGLPAEAAPEALLPAGALLHIRLNGAGALLDDTSAMAERFIPAKALGELAEAALKEPNPLLALIGMQTMGEPLSVEKLSGLTGIDPTRPVTLSVYMAQPPEGFVLCIPVLDLERPSGILSGILKPRHVEKVKLPGGVAFHITAPKVPDLHIVCAEDQVCVCGSRMLATAILSAERDARLDRSKYISSVINSHKNDNLLLVLDAQPLKPMLPVLGRYGKIPDEAIQEVRENIMDEFGPEGLASLNLQLRQHFGISNLTLLMDYGECALTGTYEVLFEYLMARADDFNGLAVALNLSDEFQTVRLSVYSKAITAAHAAKPLPLVEVGRIVSSLPGSHNFLSFQGQSPKAEKHQLPADVMVRIGQKLMVKEAPVGFYKTVLTALETYQPQQALESKVSWSITSRHIKPGKRPDQFPNLQAYIKHMMEGPAQAVVNLKAIPPQKEGFLQAHFKQQAETTNLNDQVYRRFLEEADMNQPFYVKTSRAMSEEMDGGVKKIIFENSYVTRWGLFGHNEHELINRSFTLYRNNRDHTLLYLGGTDPSILTDAKPKPVPKAIKRLLSGTKIPADANRVEIGRSLHTLLDLFDGLASVEKLIHKDLNAYLVAAQKIFDQGGPDDELLEKIAAIDMPSSVMHLKLKGDKPQLYLVTPVGWTFPRPTILPEALKLLEDYRRVADSLGGMAVYQHTRDGHFELVIVQSTAAMGALVQTVGDNVSEAYIRNEQGRQRLQKLFQTELDQQSRQDETLLTNSFWSFLDF